MKYFVVGMDTCFLHAPQIINWFDKIKIDKLHRETHYEVPFHTILQMKPDKEVEFTDILSYPCFGVSEQVKDLIVKFEPNMIWKEIMLYDSKNKNGNIYYIPVLEDVECLTERSTFNLDRSQLYHIELNERKIRDKSIFHLAGVKSQYIIMRLDLAECLLRRNIVGMNLEEVTVVKEEIEEIV